METLLLWIGRLAGLAGVVMVVCAVFSRMRGNYLLGDYQVSTILQGGIALMVIGCLAYAAVAGERSVRRG